MSNAKLSSIKSEHFTPAEIVESARFVMGGIDLDPASCSKANEIVKATNIFTKEQDGLKQKWNGRVFLNPPGGKIQNRSLAKMWFECALEKYFIGEIDQLIWIGFSVEQLGFYEEFLAFPICLCNSTATSSVVKSNGRIIFTDGVTLKPQNAPTHMGFITYLPPLGSVHERFTQRHIRRFAHEFSKYGTVFKCQLL